MPPLPPDMVSRGAWGWMLDAARLEWSALALAVALVALLYGPRMRGDERWWMLGIGLVSLSSAMWGLWYSAGWISWVPIPTSWYVFVWVQVGAVGLMLHLRPVLRPHMGRAWWTPGAALAVGAVVIGYWVR